MGSLLSTTTLMVAAAADMGLVDCVDHLLERCTDDDGKVAKRFVEMPVAELLRRTSDQHVVGPTEISNLRDTAQRCLQVCTCVLGS